MTNQRYKPENEAQLQELLAWASQNAMTFDLSGQGSRRGLGRPVKADAVLDMTAFSGIRSYEAAELVLTAGAATPLSEITAALHEKNQQLSFDPPDLGPFFGQEAGQGTLGGLIACNLAGPRRLSAGAARDHTLGVSAVSGRGDLFKAGGKVVKNVTGFDLPKLMAGSYGTLAAMTEITVKVLPAAEKSRTVLVMGLDDAQAVKAMSVALQSEHEVSSAAHLPLAAARASTVSYLSEAGGAVTAIRIEGPGPSVVHRCAALRDLLGSFGPTEELHAHNSRTLWQEVRDITPFAGTSTPVWRLLLPPSKAAGTVAAIARSLDVQPLYDRGGGLVWLEVRSGTDAGMAEVRAAVSAAGGQAALIRAPDELRSRVAVFHPQPEPLARLSARVKEAFDPKGVLNPGRLCAEF
ncbi:FAD-binding protein [Telmatospirillum sp. J64-1]|uniref:FAD-binding protein n=1 Tax=Telmatospirillum sp. J64-1 TaxID=2502183 RepID=UPI00115E6E7B|nr:FAD-binding protein [Telmatospirillum sp. J64-1]